MKNKNILVLSPHTDDETLGCGGFINKLSKDNNIFFTCFSYCGLENLKNEYTKACDKLAPNSHKEILNFKVRYFDRQEVLDRLICIRKQFNPDVVLCPSGYDIHQDHNVIYCESTRAFKDKTILGYCHHWNIIGISDLRLTVPLNESEILTKQGAMDEYKSQSHRDYFIDRGWVGKEEKLEVITWKY